MGGRQSSPAAAAAAAAVEQLRLSAACKSHGSPPRPPQAGKALPSPSDARGDAEGFRSAAAGASPEGCVDEVAAVVCCCCCGE